MKHAEQKGTAALRSQATTIRSHNAKFNGDEDTQSTPIKAMDFLTLSTRNLASTKKSEFSSTCRRLLLMNVLKHLDKSYSDHVLPPSRVLCPSADLVLYFSTR